MLRHPIYTLFGLTLLGAAAIAEFAGYTFGSPTSRFRGDPKSIRNNPGIYRSMYSGYTRYSGGK
ncbi:MAG: hypothetical protein HYZ57_05525 [Acidobacteria bacterium]|nr:hypothetical protein [Acidobacteriota bacterium]